MAGSQDPLSTGSIALSENGSVIALAMLYDAAAAAGACRCDRWDFAIEVEHLVAAGVAPTALRELRYRHLAEAGVETTRCGAVQRRFRKMNSLALPPRSCLVLTPAGENLAAAIAADVSSIAGRQRAEVRGVTPLRDRAEPIRPHWDHCSRTLAVNGRIVKRLQRPASSQAAVLNAFEEEGWPESVYDPLPPCPGIAPKRRLHNTINKLNTGLAPVIHFYGNGEGLAVCWKWIAADFARRI